MNPDASLYVLRKSIFNAVGLACTSDCVYDVYNAILQVFENFDELDSWLKRGGFLPTDWMR